MQVLQERLIIVVEAILFVRINFKKPTLLFMQVLKERLVIVVEARSHF